MKKSIVIQFLLCFALICHLSVTKSLARELSDQSKISLLTCSPGQEMYSLFGHSAIRIKDPKNRLDIVFNYGTFDFNTPNFYLKFARGKLKYRLAYTTFERFKLEYIYEKRGIIEQELNLDLPARKKLFNALINNYRPENRYYSYDFLFDNCSTRIRDIVEANSDAKVQFSADLANGKTFWNMLDHYMEQSRWIYLGIHLILGSPCDVEATPYQHMFLPDNMMYAFEDAKLFKSDSIQQSLVSKTRTIIQPRSKAKMTPWYIRPEFIFSIFAIIVLGLSLYYLNRQRKLFFIDHFLFAATGFVGWIIIFLWFFTDHQATGPNWNILWALPFHLPISNIVLAKKSKFRFYYFFGATIFYLIILASWWIIPQELPNAILPIVALLFIRSLYITKKIKLS